MRDHQGVLADAIATLRHGGLPANRLGAAMGLLVTVDDLMIDGSEEAAVVATGGALERMTRIANLVVQRRARGCHLSGRQRPRNRTSLRMAAWTSR